VGRQKADIEEAGRRTHHSQSVRRAAYEDLTRFNLRVYWSPDMNRSRLEPVMSVPSANCHQRGGPAFVTRRFIDPRAGPFPAVVGTASTSQFYDGHREVTVSCCRGD